MSLQLRFLYSFKQLSKDIKEATERMDKDISVIAEKSSDSGEADALKDYKAAYATFSESYQKSKKAIDDYDFHNIDKAVFCGYGEPTNAYDNLIKSAKYLKEINPNINLRLNTNGLSDLINEKPTAKELSSIFDYISISLNEPDSEKYDKITRNCFKGKAFDAMLKFTKECVADCPKVRMTVVDVISSEDIEKSREVCESTGAEFKVRSFAKGR